jgi:hypothetical protein
MTQLIDIADLDVVYLTYDEPNKEATWIKIQNMVPWAQRVDGIKGSDAAHKAAADASSTDRFVLIDGDNIPDTEFFNLQLALDDTNKDCVFRWKARNTINGLMYGNGGLSCWTKEFVYAMKTHENTDGSEANDVEFCFYPNYWAMHDCYSTTYPNATPFQAWRAGFREGVKMTLHDGLRVPAAEIKERVWWHNLHRLRMWSTVGSHIENGNYAIHGARLGQWMTNCTDWNYIDVRDFEILKDIYHDYAKPYEDAKGEGLVEEIKSLGEKIKLELGFDYPYLSPAQSQYTVDLYNETINLCNTYYKE